MPWKPASVGNLQTKNFCIMYCSFIFDLHLHRRPNIPWLCSVSVIVSMARCTVWYTKMPVEWRSHLPDFTILELEEVYHSTSTSGADTYALNLFDRVRMSASRTTSLTLILISILIVWLQICSHARPFRVLFLRNIWPAWWLACFQPQSNTDHLQAQQRQVWHAN